MHIVDILIVILLVVNAALGFRSGLIQSIASLVGLFAGIAIASWNYGRFEIYLSGVFHTEAMMGVVSFILIVLIVMLVAGLIGLLLRKMIQGIGLGWLDRILGLIFGLLRGALFVVLFIAVLAAFFPDTLWFENSDLAGYFMRSVDVTIQMQPGELRDRTRKGLEYLRKNSKQLLHTR
jgi:membrane protein required for colicin V production